MRPAQEQQWAHPAGLAALSSRLERGLALAEGGRLAEALEALVELGI
jgi:hypothetical protein